jgi:Protein of unknown function (DUF732)
MTAITTATIALAPSAHAYVDTDFANELHSYGIYRPKDFNAWLAKITCDRLGRGRDAGAGKSAEFLSHNLPRGTTTAQTWQFFGAAINTYCPDRLLPAMAEARLCGQLLPADDAPHDLVGELGSFLASHQ